jgi:hypothetical protein
VTLEKPPTDVFLEVVRGNFKKFASCQWAHSCPSLHLFMSGGEAINTGCEPEVGTWEELIEEQEARKLKNNKPEK